MALQGALYAIGGCEYILTSPTLGQRLTRLAALLYAPCLSYMSEWFVKKRGLANGILFAGML